MTYDHRFRRTRGMVLAAAAFSVGVVVGAAGVSSAAFAKKGWERFGDMFQQGYVAGFLDCVRIAKSMEPSSYIGQTYPLANVKAAAYAAKITELYKDPQHAGRPVSQMIEIAGNKLAAKHGHVDGLTKERIEALRRALGRRPETSEKGGKSETPAAPEAQKSPEPTDEK